MMKLGAFFHPTGHHVAAWLHPDAQIDAGTNIQHYLELAKMAERSRFDFIFLADACATRSGNLSALKRWPQYMAYFEPLTLLSAMAVVTDHIGLIATATTSYNEPYHIARKYGSLDHISGGRAGWNVVTSGNQTEAFNFGRESHFEHEDRYRRAKEFVEVVKGLWDSWDDDAFTRNRECQVYFDPAKLHSLNHKGDYFAVRGPLNLARPPQGHPILVQAGASDTGMEFAAEIAEVVFSVAPSLKKAKEFYKNLKSRMAKYGRAHSDLKIMPGLNPVVGSSAQEAEDKHQELQARIHPDVGKELLSAALGGFDLSNYDVDGPLPEVPETTNGVQSYLTYVLDMARSENLTIRDLYLRYGGARGNRTIKGTAAQIADEMEEWFVEYAVDGFLIQPAYLPGGFEEFNSTVVPELQRRCLFRTEYEGKTLRESLQLTRPASRYSAPSRTVAAS